MERDFISDLVSVQLVITKARWSCLNTFLVGNLPDTVHLYRMVVVAGKCTKQKIVDSSETICGSKCVLCFFFFLFFFFYDKGLPPPAQSSAMSSICSTSPEDCPKKKLRISFLINCELIVFARVSSHTCILEFSACTLS